ncbi:MBL fold metallo-hydrolase [Sciscionella sediminilitoris]|uniref:MBL fold metallo-hydrolase n=1 Tax=Sciscionella sediminilitoris TaxID=1445613 RepID=UPI0004DF2ABE|nr:MBL fold metallo-hydrolase [Sciscionella sp. SE31]
MLVVGFPAGALQANCYLLAGGEGQPCVIVDPGQDAVEPITEAVRKYRLSPAAVLCTHGHFDHVYSLAPVCAEYEVPAWIHPADRMLLTDPLQGLSADTVAMFGGRFELHEPDEVHALEDGAELDLADLRFTVVHTPGHTEGSVVFRTSTEDGGQVLLSGDTLFAGSIGRTDLPGGSSERMTATLRDRILPLPDETVVLPGHGSSTTIGQERAANPFLRQLEEATVPASGL